MRMLHGMVCKLPAELFAIAPAHLPLAFQHILEALAAALPRKCVRRGRRNAGACDLPVRCTDALRMHAGICASMHQSPCQQCPAGDLALANKPGALSVCAVCARCARHGIPISGALPEHLLLPKYARGAKRVCCVCTCGFPCALSMCLVCLHAQAKGCLPIGLRR